MNPYKIDWEQPRYKSVYGPKYEYTPNWKGITVKSATKVGINAGFFGGVAVFALLFYGSGIPRVQRDILQKVPFIGHYWKKEIHPQDNPF